MKRTLKVWTALGAASIAITPASAGLLHSNNIVSVLQSQQTPLLIAGEGGEGGEGAVAAAAGESLADFIAGIGFLDGHLRAAADVYALGDKDMAYVSASHTRADMDDAFLDAMKIYGAESFDVELTAFETAIENGETVEAVTKAYGSVHAKMMQSVAKSPPKDVLAAVVKLVQVSAAEFGNAVEVGKVADALEYQHSYGFVQIAKELVASISAAEKSEHPDAFATIDAQFVRLDGTWKDLSGNSPEPTEPSFIAGVAARIEIAALAVK